MPQIHDYYIVRLRASHLRWGTYRHTRTRPLIYGEGYIPIPRRIATVFNIYNSNVSCNYSPLYDCVSLDGFYKGQLLAQGSCKKGDIYAKQFAEHNNLKGLGQWYMQVGARYGDYVLVYFTSHNSLSIALLSNYSGPYPNFGNYSGSLFL